MEKEILLSLDLSTKASGWSIFEDGELKSYGVINAGSANLYHRIDKMINDLEIIIDKYKPTRVVIEEVLREEVGFNDKIFKALIYLQGFVCHLLDKFKITPEFVIVSHWRKCCGIKTGAKSYRESLKKLDIQFVKNMYGINVTDDEADAICIGYSCTHEPIPVKDTEIIKDNDGFEFK